MGTINLPRLLDGFTDKSAYFHCIYAYAPNAETEPILFMGKTHGTIVESRGDTIFGGAIFLPNGETLTYMEMESAQKNKICHRSKALQKVCDYFNLQRQQIQNK